MTMPFIKQPRILALSLLASACLSTSALAASVTSNVTPWVTGRPPTMVNPTITHQDNNTNGVVDTGDTLTAVAGTQTDPDNDAATAPTFRWSGGITSPTTAVYTVAVGDLGRTLTAHVTPHTSATETDPSSGSEYSASRQVSAAGTVTGVAITGMVSGSPQVGTPLTATATCLGGTCSGSLTYQWQLQNSEGSPSYTDIAAATGKNYTPLANQQRRQLRVTVTSVESKSAAPATR